VGHRAHHRWGPTAIESAGSPECPPGGRFPPRGKKNLDAARLQPPRAETHLRRRGILADTWPAPGDDPTSHADRGPAAGGQSTPANTFNNNNCFFKKILTIAFLILFC